MKTSFLILIFFFIPLTVFGIFFVIPHKRIVQQKNPLVIYSVQTTGSGNNKLTSFYRYDPRRGEAELIEPLKDIYLYSGPFSTAVFDQGFLVVIQEKEMLSKLKLLRYLFLDKTITSWELDVLNLYDLRVSFDGTKIVYSQTIPNEEEGGEGQSEVIVRDLNTNQEIKLMAKDLTLGDRPMSYLRPEGFGENDELFLLGGPHRPSDAGSPLYLFHHDFKSRKTELLFSFGYPIEVIDAPYDADLLKKSDSQRFWTGNIYPKPGGMFVTKGTEPREIVQVDLKSKQDKVIRIDEILNENISLPLISENRDPLSPDGTFLALDLNNRAIICRLERDRCMTQMKVPDQFQSWLSNDEVLFQRKLTSASSDSSYALILKNFISGKEQNIYTQRINPGRGNGLSQLGDQFFSFVGIIR